MHIFGICSVLCLLVSYVIDISEAECDEYFVVLEEHICSDGTGYRITPLKKENINWDDVTYPCNSTVEDFGKECLIEFNFNSTDVYCKSQINVKNNQSHYFITANHSAKLITVGTDAPEVTTNKLTEMTEIPHHRLDEESTVSMCDINIIYINENSIRNGSETTSKTTQNETLKCDYAETVCFEEFKLENKTLSDVKNTTDKTHLEEPASILLISIDRDTTSPVQPIFTGYFPESSNDSRTNYNGNFEFLKTISASCSIPKYNNCKEISQINIYFKVNYIKNNTITKYPNCALESITSENILKVKCEDVLFAKHNRHIKRTVPTALPKQEMLICQVKELKYTKLSSSDQRSENNNLHFINCSNNIKTRDSNITLISDSRNITNNSILTNDGNETIQTEAPVGINKDNSSQANPKNMVTIFITKNTNNCSQKIPLNIDEGKIIDLGVNKTDFLLRNNNIDLMLSNCINYNSSIINDKQPTSKADLTIILKNESLNASNLERFNGSSRDKSVKQKILLQCIHYNHDSSSNTTYNKTTLQCESIDLEFYNITGIYITPSSQTSNDKTANKYENKIKQNLLIWNCQILELNDTSKEHRNQNINFKNCSKDIHINNTKNNSGDKNIDQISEVKNKYTKNEFNKTENLSGKFDLNKPPPLKPKNMIKILITEIPNNCSHHLSFIIDEGKIIDLDLNTNQEKILQNNIIDLKLSRCIDVNSSITGETHPDLNVGLTIIMKNESLNAENLQLFNGTGKNESIKQRILLRCEYSNLDSNRNATSDKTAIHCESIDLNSNNITGIEISTKENVDMVEVIGNTTMKNVQLNRNGKLSTNKTVDNNANNNSLESNTNILEKKEIQKNISEKNGSHENNKKNVENNENQKTISKKKEISTNIVFNRKKDIPNGAGQNSLGLGSPETEKTMLITLMAAVGTAILMALAWRVWPKKKEYNPAPTREPPDEEETAF